MRIDHDRFVERDAEILIIGPDSHDAHKNYWATQDLPFRGLADPRHQVANAYHQRVKIFKLGRMPALVIVDKQGIVRYTYDSQSMSDIPRNEDVLKVLDGLVAAQAE